MKDKINGRKESGRLQRKAGQMIEFDGSNGCSNMKTWALKINEWRSTLAEIRHRLSK